MNSIPILASAAALAALLAGCGGEVSASGDPAAACRACHQGPSSLAGTDAGKLAEKIRRIRDGGIAHPPLGLRDDSDAAIDALAAQLGTS